MAEKLYLVDGHAHLYRAFYGVRGLATQEGRPSNAVFGFTAMLRKLIRDHRPEFLAVAFDMPGPTFRHAMYEPYKATRETPPDEFRAQLPMTREVLEAMAIPVFTAAGYEADDVLGTLTRVGVEHGLDVVLVTGDKDASQLLGPHVEVLDTYKNDTLTAAGLKERDGLEPEQVVDAMALSGDTSDNVPGVPKVGPKTARKLIGEYGSLEGVLAHAAEIKAPKLRANLQRHADLARLSRDLVTIDTNVPLEVDLEACRFRPPDASRLAPVFRKLNFHRFLEEFDLPATRDQVAYHLVNTQARFKKFLAMLRQQPRFAMDLETTSPSPRAAKIVGLSFSWREREAWYVPVRGPVGARTLEAKAVLAALRPVLTDPAVGKIGQNIKYDMIVLRNDGIELAGVVFDTMIAAYILNAERRHYSLGELAADMLHHRMTPISDLIGKGRQQVTMDCVPLDDICAYACADADITRRLATRLEKELKEQGFWELYSTMELPLVSVLADMEHRGIGFDAGILEEMSDWLGGEIEKLVAAVHKEAGETFNVASPKQLSVILFEKMGLPVTRRTKTGPSTNSDVLDQLAVEHRLPRLVLEFRHLSKLKSTYVDALPRMVCAETGRIHTSFHQTGTATGRLSSSDPNLQNIPVRTEIGERIRRAFAPTDPDLVFLAADYSQIELRILAHLSADQALRRAFAQDEDIHRFVAAQIHGVPLDEVTPAMRRAAKTVNFGIIYGLTPFGLSRDMRVPVHEAAAFIEEYFERYPDVKRFIDATIAAAHDAGYVCTLCGRRRPLPGLADRNRAVRQFAERAAVNTVIQGTAADMIKLAMIRLHARLRRADTRARMILQIHDELLFELPADDTQAVRAMVTEEMTRALAMDVPVKVNLSIGRNWMEAK